MKRVHWVVWVALVLLILLAGRQCEMYAPPRDENTMPPFTENTGNVMKKDPNRPYIDTVTSNIQVDSQTQIYKDMAGLDFQIQAGNPILNFIQGNPLNGTVYGDFLPFESLSGNASMYYIVDAEQDVTPLECPTSQININGKRYIPGTYSLLIDGTNEPNLSMYSFDVYPPLTIIARGPDGEVTKTFEATTDCPQAIPFRLDTSKKYESLELVEEYTTSNITRGNVQEQKPESQTISMRCRSSMIVVNGNEYGIGTYTGLDLTSEIKVYPPLTVTATGPEKASQTMTYTTDQTCPQPSRLVLDKDKTFDTIILTVQ